MSSLLIQSLKTKFFLAIGVIVIVLIGEYVLLVNPSVQLEESGPVGENLKFLSLSAIALILAALGVITFLVFRPILHELSSSDQPSKTDETRSQESLDSLKEERDRAQRITETKDKVVSLIAHDLKNPLGAIRGFSEFMLIDEQDPLSDQQRKSIQHIYDQSDDMLTLISDVLDISRLQTGNIVITNVFADAHYLVEKILQRLQAMATAKQVTLVNKVPTGTRIYGDSTLLGQVFQNLLTNAIKFSHASGDVHVQLEESGDPETISIGVRDFGIGVSDKLIGNLFKLEEKTSTDGTSGEKGSGFGLPLTHQIMRAHKGDLQVSSREGEGSTFTIILQNETPRVLVVDDDPIFRKIIRQYLLSMQADVTECGNGEEAWNLLMDDFRPHLIISDIQMPVRNGIDLLVDIRMHMKMSQIPVIMVTGDSDERTRERVLKLGATDFVAKPINPGDFVPCEQLRHR